MSEPTATTSEIKTTGSKTTAELEKQLMRAKQLIVGAVHGDRAAVGRFGDAVGSGG